MPSRRSSLPGNVAVERHLDRSGNVEGATDPARGARPRRAIRFQGPRARPALRSSPVQPCVGLTESLSGDELEPGALAEAASELRGRLAVGHDDVAGEVVRAPDE